MLVSQRNCTWLGGWSIPPWLFNHIPASNFFPIVNVRLLNKVLFKESICIYTAQIRRGARSDAQLMPTETRFQKCSQSGKNGSKHPILSISMAYNVISCKKNRKKHSNNQNRWFYYICKFGSRAQKWRKIAKKTDHSIAIYSIFCIGMVYFGCLQVNPHIQAVQNMCSKGG